MAKSKSGSLAGDGLDPQQQEDLQLDAVIRADEGQSTVPAGHDQEGHCSGLSGRDKGVQPSVVPGKGRMEYVFKGGTHGGPSQRDKGGKNKEPLQEHVAAPGKTLAARKNEGQKEKVLGATQAQAAALRS